MSLKKLFLEENKLQSAEPLSKDDFKDEVESFDYAAAIKKRDARFLAIENFDDPSVFARYGSAEKYYHDSISHIYNSYPYDGSLKEKILWELSSSLLDVYLFDNGYPRTTGYANFLTSPGTSGEAGSNWYPSSGDNEYILVKGGPHAGSGQKPYYNKIKDSVEYRKDGNIFNLADERENNLLIDGTRGNTVEFWLKKDAYIPYQDYFEYIFDAHVTGTVENEADFGRFTVALATTGTTGNGNNQAIWVQYGSGSQTNSIYIGSSTLTKATIADGAWHHYALRAKTSGSNTIFDLFVDGQYNDTTTANKTIDYVSGAIVATVGAQAAPVTATSYGSRGWSKFSGSLDEIRYWKTWRTSKQLQRYWFDQVGGGTNTDLSNVDLGVYLKFNEGITGDTTTDSTVLDYSGRVSNGAWTGYSSNSRNTGSAIDSANAVMTSFSGSEFKDPIVYSTHPDVSTYLTNMTNSGSVYDDTNTNAMTSYIPSWIMNENSTPSGIKDKNYLTNLLQVISSYFDEASLLIEKLPNLVQQKYYSGVANPPPFNKKGLDSVGFVVPELFIAADLLENIEDRDDRLKFEKTLQEVKNTIYQNIYNNLNYIYKSKGTIKSFRNLFHCFGFGDEILKFNLYGNNTTYKLEDNLKFTTKNKNYINFNEIGNSDASIYQYKIDSTATSFISGTGVTNGTYENAGLSFTLESNIVLPNRVSIAEYHTVKETYEGKTANAYPLIVSSSLFGVHSAKSTENDLTWAADDFANFQVLTIKDDKYSSNAYFKLTGTVDSDIPVLSSPYFENVYDDQLWTVSVTVEPTKKESSNQVSGSGMFADSTYTVRFYGVSYIADYKAQEFHVSGTMTNAQGREFISSRKRVFVGAHRNNFTGSVRNQTDVKINSCKAWMNTIATGTIDQHNLKLGNYGPKSATQNAFLYQESVNGVNIPEIKTLALMWDFSTVTGSDANGQFAVKDESSGSATDNRYSWFSDVVSRRHTASGSFFNTSSTNVVQSLERGTYQSQLPEILLDSNLTRILSQDDEYFNRNTRPLSYHMSIEKNMFHDISEEMLNMFGSVVWFNNMIGNPVNVYRGEYKELKKAAQLFFEKVGNDYDFDKYLEYFKLIDTAVSYYILELIPASMLTFDHGISTMVENFVLGDRDKFANKYPLMKDVKPKEIIGEALGINELLYDWKHGHAPVSSDPNEQDDNCLWWSERAKATNVNNDTGDADVDKDRQSIKNAKINQTNASAPTLYDSTTSQVYSGSTYATRRLARIYNIDATEAPKFHGGSNRYPNHRSGYYVNKYRPNLDTDPSGSVLTYLPTKSCDDDKTLRTKEFRNYVWASSVGEEDIAGKIVSPFNIVSASVDVATSAGTYGVDNKLQVVDIHNDLYGADSGDAAIQGPFTDAHVGGLQSRHISLNTDSDDMDTRPELFRLKVHAAGSDRLLVYNSDQDLAGQVNANLPRANYYRNVGAKRPVNIANIVYNTSSAILGNYSNGYEIVLTNGRSINNRFLAEGDGDLGITTTDSPYVSGVIDFTLPRFDLTGTNNFIIVNRFSAPGDPSTMAAGMLDITSGEYSVYNSLPWRNLNNRLSLNELYRDHSKQFGYFSDAFYSSSWTEAIRSGIKGAGTYPGGSGSVDEEHYYADSVYTDATASFQKVNRNSRKQPQFADADASYENLGDVDTTKLHDNWYIQHQIPQTDVQYAWITASIISGYTGSALYGYEEKGYSRADLASSDLTFVTNSIVASVPYGLSAAPTSRYYGVDSDSGWPFNPSYPEFDPPLTGVIPTDFANLNTIVYEPLTSSTNTLGYPTALWDGSYSTYINRTAWPRGKTAGGPYQYVPFAETNATVLNSILLNRHGPYGGANWKLYKKDNHPIVRHQKNNNIIGAPYSILDSSNLMKFKVISDYGIKNYTEPPVTSKFKPLLYITQQPALKGKALGTDPIKNLASLGNLRVHFTDHTKETLANRQDLNLFLPTGQSIENLKLITYSPYASFKKLLDETQNLDFVQINYTETIYPKGLYTYLSGTRKRLNFKNDFWRSERLDRSVEDALNSAGVAIDLSSIWKLDAHEDYTTSTGSIPFSQSLSPPYSTEEDGSGELQNAYCLYHYGSVITCKPAVNYNRRIKLIHPNSGSPVFSPVGGLWNSKEPLSESNPFGGGLPRFDFLSDSPYPVRLSGAVGDTLWEVTTSAGAKPFYDSYDDYAEEGFRNLKEGTILPEYRISEKINDYVNAGLKLDYSDYHPWHFYGLDDDKTNPLRLENGALSLTGSSIVDSTTNVDEFLQRYVFSDFYKYFSLVDKDYNNEPNNPPKKKLVCDAILKFLPYDGFYPAERVQQLGEIFMDSLADSDLSPTAGAATNNMRTAVQPFFAPGVLCNSIKSGIAVDYPIFTNANQFAIQSGSVIWGNMLSGNFAERLNIDSLLQPPIVNIIDAEVDPDAAINSTASLQPVYPQHTFAMSNFLAESVNTFTNGQSFIHTKPYSPSDSVVPPKTDTFTMDIVLKNSKTYGKGLNVGPEATDPLITMLYGKYPEAVSSSLQINSSSITMYDRAITGYNIDPFLYGSSFGPPVEAGVFTRYVPPGVSSAYFSASNGYGNTGYLWASTFDPFTPSYYNGYSVCTLTVPLNSTEDYDMAEIVSALTHSYQRLNTFKQGTYFNRAVGVGGGPIPGQYSPTNAKAAAEMTTSYKHAMQISASVYMGDEDPNNIVYQRIDGDNVKEVIAFKTRWETPVLDFTNVVPTPMYKVTGNIAKGMWHQYGEEPVNKGIVLEAEVASNNQSKSLASILNLDLNQKQFIGGLNTKHSFGEAIVAIPFKYDESKKETEFYDVDLDMVNFIRDKIYFNPIDAIDAAARIRTYDEIATLVAKLEGIKIDKDMYNLIAMMRNYVIPPHLDWLHNPIVRPYTMFMIEYSIDLTKEDIKNMWQNVEPTFARQALRVRSESNAYSFQTNETENLNTMFFNNDPFKDENTRWAIFKVKKRARGNYNSVVGKINVRGEEYIRKDLIGQTRDFLYSYNWPYDFFSLIELAKIDSINTFNPIYNEDKTIEVLSKPFELDINLNGFGDGDPVL